MSTFQPESPNRGETEARNQPYMLGVVTSYNQLTDIGDTGIQPENMPRAVWRLEIADPYVERYPAATRLRIQTAEKAADNQARLRREQGAWQRKPHTAYFDTDGNEVNGKTNWGDPHLTRAFFDSHGEALKLWQKAMIPKPEALKYISDPLTPTHVVSRPRKDKPPVSVPMDETIREWHSLCTDGRGIRNRATVMAELARDYVRMHPDEKYLPWMSIACGTAIPTIQAAVASGMGDRISLDLVDYDEYAMNAIEGTGTQLGFEGKIHLSNPLFMFDPGFNALRQYGERITQEGRRPRLIDMMGIFEYTGNNLNIDSAGFLGAAYDLLAPGGRLLVGQMRTDRPNPDFTLGVVAWPHIETRTPDELMGIVAKAGINLGNVEMFLPDDNVYTVLCIDKPELATSADELVTTRRLLGAVVQLGQGSQ